MKRRVGETMWSQCCRLLFCVLCFGPAVTAAREIVVTPVATGASALAGALDTAAPGDVIRLRRAFIARRSRSPGRSPWSVIRGPSSIPRSRSGPDGSRRVPLAKASTGRPWRRGRGCSAWAGRSSPRSMSSARRRETRLGPGSGRRSWPEVPGWAGCGLSVRSGSTAAPRKRCTSISPMMPTRRAVSGRASRPTTRSSSSRARAMPR